MYRLLLTDRKYISDIWAIC